MQAINGSYAEALKNAPRSTINQIGYLPVAGQIVAVGRGVYGSLKFAVFTILALGTLLICPFSKTARSWTLNLLNAASDGLLHIGRAFIEIIPIGGGIVLYFYDEIRLATSGTIPPTPPNTSSTPARYPQAQRASPNNRSSRPLSTSSSRQIGRWRLRQLSVP